MAKHQLLRAGIRIDDFEFVSRNMKEDELKEYVKHGLAERLVDEIMKNNIGTIVQTDDIERFGKIFDMSLVVINKDDYIKLRDAIIRNNSEVLLEDGRTTQLINLL